MGCPLCELKTITKLYYKTEKVIVLSCASCHVPMAVLRRHSMNPTAEEEQEMMQALNEIAIDFFGGTEYFIDKKQRSIFDHLHYHVRRRENAEL